LFALRLTRRALDDLDTISAYIAKKSGSSTVAHRFVERLLQLCSRLCETPFKLGRSCEDLGAGIRCVPEGNYLILFRYSADQLEVARIVEGHRALLFLFSDGDA